VLRNEFSETHRRAAPILSIKSLVPKKSPF
jgi:hypothetical protein